jgi:hypothetical protein
VTNDLLYNIDSPRSALKFFSRETFISINFTIADIILKINENINERV